MCTTSSALNAARRILHLDGHGSHGNPNLARRIAEATGAPRRTPGAGFIGVTANASDEATPATLTANADPSLNFVGRLAAVRSTGGIYQFVNFTATAGPGVAPPVDGRTVLATNTGGTTRWIRIS